MSTRLRLLGSTHRFFVSDSTVVTVNGFLGINKYTGQGSMTRNTQGVGIGVSTPGYFKANGAGYAEDPSGAETYAEVYQGVPEVYLA